ncbi:MAG: hypothetical protein KKE02_21760 [Alphaproteobacteria bacterium]|nr:hypothetical protein [Alphaproteobacteria bacterium]MBU1515970.1 hypothetical protein [Alphaproteobacteria bacterium]MBU2092815.1 hypothetical protein [Alphaproteobacteria bacterium]MBU2153660.1 hypothetical protein [Alphaproteobacteria bacterium]MBU2308288.1 hypothetical protein [Alphaproteobacteria bacterium]
MSSVNFIRRPNRLGKLISTPGGRKLGEAVAMAESGIETLRPALQAEVDAALDRLRAAAGRTDAAAHAEVYACATAIVGAAGLCGLTRVGEVAYNLCELSDRYIEAGVWNEAAIAAHIQTMGVLRMANLPDDSPDAQAVLDGLKALVRRAEEKAAQSEG